MTTPQIVMLVMWVIVLTVTLLLAWNGIRK
jgi:hypothetical protein